MFADSLTLARARREFFVLTGFRESDYSNLIAKFKVGPFPLYFYNFKSRRDAVAIHEVHHILTGYDTSLIGEGQVSAWELGSGFKPTGLATTYILLGAATGLILDRKKTWAAFRRGLRSRNLYGQTLTPKVLLKTLGQLRREYGLA